VLDCARTMISWACRPMVQQLPITLGNPFGEDLVGHRPTKDPLRPVVFPPDLRKQIVGQMDAWQLCQLGIDMVLPLRPEDYTGLLISEVDFTGRVLHFGTRFGGGDFNKGQQSFRVPYPPELDSLLHRCVADRSEGPLLRQRTIADGRHLPKVLVQSTEELEELFRREMASAKPGTIQAKQDGKQLFRRLLRSMGGVSPDSLAKEFRKASANIQIPVGARFYDLR